LWELVFAAWDQARAAVLAPVRIVYMTHDVALKVLGKSGDSVCKLVLRDKTPNLIIVDEAQRANLMSLLAWASSACMLIALGDPLQLLPQESKQQVRALLPSLAAPDEAAEAQEWSSLVTYQAPDFLEQRSKQWTLSTSKRTGEPLLSYCKQLFEKLRGFTARPGLVTEVSIVKFSTPADEWLSAQEVCEAARLQAPEQDSEGNRPVIWHHKLYSAVLMRAVECLLHHEANFPGHTPEQPLVLITSALRRVLGPLRLFVEQMLAWPDFYASTGLQQLDVRHVVLRTSGHITGPTYAYVIVVRHRRTKPPVGQPDEGDDAHRGLQQAPAVNYVQITRARLHATIFCEDSPPGAKGSCRDPRDKRRMKYREMWDSARGLDIPVATWKTDGQWCFTEISGWMQRGHRWKFPEPPAGLERMAAANSTHKYFLQRLAGLLVASSCTQSITSPITELVPRLGQLPVVQSDFIQTRKAHIDMHKLATAATFSHAGGPKTLPGAIVASWGHSIVKGLPIHVVWLRLACPPTC
jgi:hypothetical protein